MQGYLLQVAARAAAFAIEHGRDESGAWIVELSGDGKRVYAPAEPGYIPTTGYGSAFVAEGLAEYALAKHDAAAFALAVELLRAFVVMMDDPSRRGDVSAAWTAYPGMRGLGHHMIALNLTRQLLLITDAAESDASVAAVVEATQRVAPLASELRALSDRMVDCILNKFMHPEFGLGARCSPTTTRAPTTQRRPVLCGHSIETLWMVMAEAERRADEALYARAARLFHRHVERRRRLGGYVARFGCRPRLLPRRRLQGEVGAGRGSARRLRDEPRPSPRRRRTTAPASGRPPSTAPARVGGATIRGSRAYLDAQASCPTWPGRLEGRRRPLRQARPRHRRLRLQHGVHGAAQPRSTPRPADASRSPPVDRALAASTRGLRW